MRRHLMRRLTLAALAVLLTAAGRLPPAAIPVSRMDTPWWRARFEQKQAELHQSRRVDLIWLGDSITQDWELTGPPEWRDFTPVWQRFYGDRHAINLGFKGDNTGHLLWRLQHGEIDNIDPKLAIILIGANNMGHVHWNAQDTVLGIETVLQEVHRHLPNTKILLLSVLPSARSNYVTVTTQEINAMLAAKFPPGSPVVTYKDVTSLFVLGGHLDISLFLDRFLSPPDPALHPTAQAQARLAEFIEPTVATLLGDRPH